MRKIVRGYLVVEHSGYSRHVCSTVRKAYKQKALETHPDKLGPDASDEEKQTAHDEVAKVSLATNFAGGGVCQHVTCTGPRGISDVGGC